MEYPVREALLAYIELLKDDAIEDYRLQALAYNIRGGNKPPELPAILKEKGEKKSRKDDPRWANVKRPSET